MVHNHQDTEYNHKLAMSVFHVWGKCRLAADEESECTVAYVEDKCLEEVIVVCIAYAVIHEATVVVKLISASLALMAML